MLVAFMLHLLDSLLQLAAKYKSGGPANPLPGRTAIPAKPMVRTVTGGARAQEHLWRSRAKALGRFGAWLPLAVAIVAGHAGRLASCQSDP